MLLSTNAGIESKIAGSSEKIIHRFGWRNNAVSIWKGKLAGFIEFGLKFRDFRKFSNGQKFEWKF